MVRRSLPVISTLLAVSCGPATKETVGGEHGEHHHQHGKRFENADEWTKVFDDPTRDEWQHPDEVVQLLGLEPGMTVVDLGTGTGYFVPRLSKAVGKEGKVLALDVEPDMVRFVRERANKFGRTNVEAKVIAFDDPGLAPASVDRVLIVDTWHHIGNRGEYVKKLAAALKPKGFVAIVDFTLESKKGPPPDHRISPAQAIDELAKGGLEARALEETLPDQYFVVGSVR